MPNFGNMIRTQFVRQTPTS